MPRKRKIPKYILNFLKRRKIAAQTFISLTSKIDDWLERENIPATYVTKNGDRLEDYTNTGCISLCEPENGEEGFIHIVEDFFNNSK